MVNGVSRLTADNYHTFLAYGDCLVLVTRVTTGSTANVRKFRVYYRIPLNSAGGLVNPLAGTNVDLTGPVYYYQSADYGVDGTATVTV